MHSFAHLQPIIIALTKIHEKAIKIIHIHEQEQEPPLITICANFQVGGGGGGGGGLNVFLPMIMSYEFIVFWKSFEY